MNKKASQSTGKVTLADTPKGKTWNELVKVTFIIFALMALLGLLLYGNIL
jgi:hypothetical protein